MPETGSSFTLKRKRSSPFRIKLGCVVALRYRPGGNLVPPVNHSSQLNYSEVWTDPQPGRDEGLALIGSRVRCCFPKSVMSDEHGGRALSRFLEGEIVSLVNYPGQIQEQRLSRRKREAQGTCVELLIAEEKLQSMPFLKRVDKLFDPSTMGKSAKRQYINETKIKGEGKAIVIVVLSDISGIALKKRNAGLEAKWVIRKRLPNRMRTTGKARKTALPLQDHEGLEVSDHSSVLGKTDGHSIGSSEVSVKITLPKFEKSKKDFSSPKFLGDGNDSKDQQEKNWRWQASRISVASCLANHANTGIAFQRLCYPLVGEVVKIETAVPTAGTMAFVTIKELFLPEHISCGRMPHHELNQVFENHDSIRAVVDGPSSTAGHYRVAVEELVVVSRRLLRPVGDSAGLILASPSHDVYDSRGNVQLVLCNSLLFSSKSNHFCPREMGFDSSPRKLCSRCKTMDKHTSHSLKAGKSHWICARCIDLLKRHCSANNSKMLPLVCEFAKCRDEDQLRYEAKFSLAVDELKKRRAVARTVDDKVESVFGSACAIAKLVKNSCFGLWGQDFDHTSIPASKPITRIKPRVPKKRKKGRVVDLKTKTTAITGNNRNDRTSSSDFESSSCRLWPYDTEKRRFQTPYESVHVGVPKEILTREKPRNMRLSDSVESGAGDQEKDEKINTRAARANQRRLLRDVARIGFSVDTLSGREQSLRFDRSKIHAWGVFADEELKEGELLVEYRGEVIGNSMAEKREEEYERAKIGSDYMFRVDTFTVCDATKQGNVARFINHSCDANCYTKIISTDGCKRIVVYAKRDIRAGEELCYDYKFPLEYDESKRIPCHCGSKDCREYMN